jgi:hypothetical protein
MCVPSLSWQSDQSVFVKSKRGSKHEWAFPHLQQLQAAPIAAEQRRFEGSQPIIIKLLENTTAAAVFLCFARGRPSVAAAAGCLDAAGDDIEDCREQRICSKNQSTSGLPLLLLAAAAGRGLHQLLASVGQPAKNTLFCSDCFPHVCPELSRLGKVIVLNVEMEQKGSGFRTAAHIARAGPGPARQTTLYKQTMVVF